MAVREHTSVVERRAGERASLAGERVSVAGTRSIAGELAEADQLIADLSALLDAGLVVVHERVLGPPRYGLAADLDSAA